MSFKSKQKLRGMSFRVVLVLVLLLVAFKVSQSLLPEHIGPRSVLAASKSDLDGNGIVDINDLDIYSLRRFKKGWDEVDWCYWLEQDNVSGKPTSKEEKKAEHARKHLGDELRNFIIDEFGCDVTEPPEPNEPPVDPLAVINSNDYPTRLALGSDHLYVTDTASGSVFIYDVNSWLQNPNFLPYDPNLLPIAELKGFNKPLGIAVNQEGLIYIGNDARDCVEVYEPNGTKIANIGKGLFKMPNDLAIDDEGKLYIADSKSNTVWVFDPNEGVADIGGPGSGAGELDFPVAVTIRYYTDASGQKVSELFVADQGNYEVKVFDLQGNFLRSFGRALPFWGSNWKGRWGKMQSLAFDHLGRLHIADSFTNRVQIIDPNTGAYIDYYGQANGEPGIEPGQLNTPLDIIIDEFGRVIVANYRNKRFEVIYTVAP